MFEIHIAIPKLSASLTNSVILALSTIGLPKSKYFLGVYNLPADGSQQACTPPTGHDLEDPAVMTSLKTNSLHEAIERVRAGMAILKDHGVKGNFEVEEIAVSPLPETAMDLSEILPEFQRVPDSPGYENHIVWKGAYALLPDNKEIADMILKSCGVRPHQIVDFAYSPNPKDSDIVTRVATIYQPNREKTLKFGLTLANQKNFLGCSYTVSEQVHMVGEYREISLPVGPK